MKTILVIILLMAFSSVSLAYVPKHKLESAAKVEIQIFEYSHPGVSVKVKENRTQEIIDELTDAKGIPADSGVLREFNSGSVFIALCEQKNGCGPDTKK